MSNVAIRVVKLGKKYCIGAKSERHRTFREVISDAMTAPLRNLQNWSRYRSRDAADRTDNVVWAANNISFEVKEREVVGVIGRNGAGKSTLLKILARITEPTEGYAEIYGRVASLLEVGTGFHPELTGRENIFLNGAILGMRKTEIEDKFSDIVEFSEVEKFIDTPVKHYSSGMQLRLAFAVAAHLEPEILLMDEVLAVGDASFQKKCIGKMKSIAGDGRTVLFVSHSMSAIRELCTRAVWIDNGTVRADGDVDEVIQSYLKSLSAGAFRFINHDFGLSIEEVSLRNTAGTVTSNFEPDDDLFVDIHFDAVRKIDRPYVMLVVEGLHGNCFTANMLWDGHRPEMLLGKGTLRCQFRSLPLLPQSYTIKMAIRAGDGRQTIIPLQEVTSFDVTGRLEDYGLTGDFYTAASRSTSVVNPYVWHLPDGSERGVRLKRVKPPSPAPLVQTLVKHSASDSEHAHSSSS